MRFSNDGSRLGGADLSVTKLSATNEAAPTGPGLALGRLVGGCVREYDFSSQLSCPGSARAALRIFFHFDLVFGSPVGANAADCATEG